jgi:hypothetical protein
LARGCIAYFKYELYNGVFDEHLDKEWPYNHWVDYRCWCHVEENSSVSESESSHENGTDSDDVYYANVEENSSVSESESSYENSTDSYDEYY